MPIGHLGVNVRDLGRARAYYDRLMPLLGFEPFKADETQFSYKPAENKPGTYLFFYRALAGGPYVHDGAGLGHIAFIVRDRATVHAVHDLVRQLGSEVVYPPQEFPQYHSGYYAVFWRDPEGFTVEAVCHREET